MRNERNKTGLYVRPLEFACRSARNAESCSTLEEIAKNRSSQRAHCGDCPSPIQDPQSANGSPRRVSKQAGVSQHPKHSAGTELRLKARRQSPRSTRSVNRIVSQETQASHRGGPRQFRRRAFRFAPDSFSIRLQSSISPVRFKTPASCFSIRRASDTRATCQRASS